ncbi:MAG: hypothetical protein E7241_01560 [Lachnospiraceae bacterium]|jgi:hypothetical protein|nr:hypothetical protein [Lachnospiraceae bacterium]
MNLLNKIERKFGKLAIPNLPKWIILTYIIGYVIYYLYPTAIAYIYLEPELILKGQVWRLITWVFVPPTTTNIFFVLIMLFFYYSISTTLEQTWGSFRFTFYIITGLLFMIIGSFVLYLLTPNYLHFGILYSTHYINLAIFLAFAATYPDMTVMLYFLIPLKIKWLALVDVVIIIIDFVRATLWETRVAIIASVLNFLLFFLLSRKYKSGVTPTFTRQKPKRKAEAPKRFNPHTGGITKHKCAICGRTENDGIDLEFRFCTKCNGNYEYCQDHLFTHTHKQ